jgi:hypothetical protein
MAFSSTAAPSSKRPWVLYTTATCFGNPHGFRGGKLQGRGSCRVMFVMLAVPLFWSCVRVSELVGMGEGEDSPLRTSPGLDRTPRPDISHPRSPSRSCRPIHPAACGAAWSRTGRVRIQSPCGPGRDVCRPPPICPPRGLRARRPHPRSGGGSSTRMRSREGRGRGRRISRPGMRMSCCASLETHPRPICNLIWIELMTRPLLSKKWKFRLMTLTFGKPFSFSGCSGMEPLIRCVADPTADTTHFRIRRAAASFCDF